MKRLLLLLSAAVIFSCFGETVRLKVDPERVLNKIDDRIYGFLLEHIYRSCSNGVWGEEVFNRSFEDLAAVGNWRVHSDGTMELHGAGMFRFKATSPLEVAVRGSAIVGVGDQSRDAMRTNYFDWHVREGFVERAEGWKWYAPSTTITRIKCAVAGEGIAKIEWNKDKVVGWLDGEKAFETNGMGDGEAILGGNDGGDVTFAGIDRKQPFRYWEIFGDADVEVSSDALNGEASAHLTLHGSRSGIVQRGTFATKKGDKVAGSLWMKGSACEVFVNGESIGSPDGEWREYHFELADDDAPDATLEIAAEGMGEVWLDHVSAMCESSRESGGFRADILEAVRALKPTILRWPGGSFVEHYNWRDGMGPQHKRRGVRRWGGVDPLAFGTDEFLRFCKLVGAEPHIVLPMGYHNWRGWDPGETDWTRRALDWIEYIGERAGIFELDNETWKMPPALYVAEARKMASAIRAVRPDATIIACGCGRLGKEGEGLDDAVRKGLGDIVDFASPHHYQSISKFDGAGVEEMRQYIVSREMPIAFTEWNLDGQDMRTGLFTAGFLNMLERTPVCPIAEAALLLRHTSATGWNNAFINFDRRGWYYAPNAVVFKLWSESRLPRRVAIEGNANGLDVSASVSEDGTRLALKAVNASNASVPLTVRIASTRRWQLKCARTVAAPSLDTQNTMEEKNNVCIRELSASAGNVILPEWSATVVEYALCADLK